MARPPWFVAVPLLLALTRSSHALPIDGHERGFHEGANHHLGDAGFVAAFHRAPTGADGEAARMHAHLTYVRALLAARAATKPDLEATRARYLSYLDDYIAKGVTPDNAHLPWRTPVFIDDHGDICAVGYLIERSSGRALPERIAREHRYDFLEDIAAAMPEVRAWASESGFTLDELASIQPGYMAPEASTWHPWNLSKQPVADGPFTRDDHGERLTGAILGGAMEGAWTLKDADGKPLGRGTFHAGKGTWTSQYADGKTMAEGPFSENAPAGAWRFFHESGNLAAEGRFVRGARDGDWKFYYDTDARTVLAEGAFVNRRIAGSWRHYDGHGHLLATSQDVYAASWRGEFGEYLLDVLPSKGGVHQYVHQGNIAGDHHRLDLLSGGSEPLYVTFRDRIVYDAGGHALTKVDGRWRSSDCHWSRARKAAARAGDVVTVHALLARESYDEHPRACGEPVPVGGARGKHLDAMLASLSDVRSASPDFVRKLALGDETLEGDEDDYAKERAADAGDLRRVLASNMTWYVEWPHVDGRFLQVFATLPGYSNAPEE